jgi:hypothetical protein
MRRQGCREGKATVIWKFINVKISATLIVQRVEEVQIPIYTFVI